MKTFVSQDEAQRGNATASPVNQCINKHDNRTGWFKCVFCGAKNPSVTDFDADMHDGHKFWLGPIVRAHNIGEYQFIEHRHLIREGCTVTRKVDSTAPNEFACYINGKSTSCGAESLDHALALVIARKHDGINSQAAMFFMKMISNEEKAS